MSFSNIGTFACRALQQKLIDYYGANTAEMKTMGSVALIRWLLSPQNTSGFRQITNAITGAPATVPGKLRAVAFALDLPYCYDVCAPSGVTCTTQHDTLENNTQEVVFDFDNSAPFRPCNGEGEPMMLRFTRDELAKYCTETDTSYITRKIAAFNRRFVEALDKRYSEILETKVGTTATGGYLTRLPYFIQHASGLNTLNPEAKWYQDKVYSDIGGVGSPAIIGGSIVNKIALYHKWARIVDAGLDLGMLGDGENATFYDRNMDTTLGLNQFFMLSPGAVQLVSYNENVGEYKQEITDLYTNGTFIDPLTGLEIDFEWRYDYDCKIYTYKPYLYTELAAALPGGCGLPTSNGLLLFEDCSLGVTPPVCADSE